MRRTVVMILDGLRRDFIDAARMPHLHSFAARATSFGAHRSIFPSATRCVSATFATGCYAARHGLQGNAVALVENGILVAHDAGVPGFLQHKRTVTGCTLAVPTLAERLTPYGGAVIFSNVSPGAAYAHDPDGFGHLYHRAGSFAPGRVPTERLGVTLDAAGDRIATEHFIAEALGERRPALALLWCGEPDHIQHDHPLGSPEHLAVLAAADANAAMVIVAVDQLRAAGDEVLLVMGSDHGHETVEALVDVEGDLIAAGLKAGRDSADVIAQSNGTSVLIYIAAEHATRQPALEAFLRGRDWAGEVFNAEQLGAIGQAPHNGLVFAVSMRANEVPNRYGIPGSSLAALPRSDPHPVGAGQHGGLGRYEQSPFLMIDGEGFAAGTMCMEPSRIVDIAPTILSHLRLPATGMDGRPLQGSPVQA